MKKILFLLLLSVTMYGQVPADATPLENIQITNNIQDTISDRVSVSTSDGVLNWKYAKDLIIPAKAFLSTGLIKNGLLSINADPTKFNITAGIGIISNFDDPENPTSTIINFPAFTAVTPTYLLTGSITYVAINSTPAVVMQATAFTPEQRRSLIVLGAVIHSNLTNINVVNNISAPTNATTNQLHDFIEAVGALNLTGNKYTANGANLQLNKSAGLIFKLGSNFANDWKNPHELAQTAGTSLTFRYRTQNGTEGSDRINLDPALYDLNNVLTSVPNNKFTIQTVTMFQSGVTRIQYGQNVYDDLATAKNAVFTRKFILEPNSKENGIIRAYIIMKNTTTSLQNVADADILEAQKFGGVASGGVALTLANIVTALGFTPENVANKSDSYTAISTTTYPNTKALVDGLAKDNVSKYGILTTNSASINSANMALIPPFVDLVFLEGVYLFSAPISYKGNNFIGQSGKTILKFPDTAGIVLDSDYFASQGAGFVNYVVNKEFRDFSIESKFECINFCKYPTIVESFAYSKFTNLTLKSDLSNAFRSDIVPTDNAFIGYANSFKNIITNTVASATFENMSLAVVTSIDNLHDIGSTIIFKNCLLDVNCTNFNFGFAFNLKHIIFNELCDSNYQRAYFKNSNFEQMISNPIVNLNTESVFNIYFESSHVQFGTDSNSLVGKQFYNFNPSYSGITTNSIVSDTYATSKQFYPFIGFMTFVDFIDSTYRLNTSTLDETLLSFNVAHIVPSSAIPTRKINQGNLKHKNLYFSNELITFTSEDETEKVKKVTDDIFININEDSLNKSHNYILANNFIEKPLNVTSYSGGSLVSSLIIFNLASEQTISVDEINKGINSNSTLINKGANNVKIYITEENQPVLFPNKTYLFNNVTKTVFNITSPFESTVLIGNPTAPTATPGTNTNQIATTAFVTSADSGNVKLTGNQTINGIKTFANSGEGASGGIYSYNTSFGDGIYSENIAGGVGLHLNNFSGGNNIVSNNSATGTGFNYVGQNQDINTFTVDKLGATTANSFIKTGGTSSQFLKADGSVDESDVVRNIAKEASQGSNITGTVSETVLYSKLIPANTFKDGDFMTLFSRVVRPSPTASSGGLNQRVRINTSNTLTGATQIAINGFTAGVNGNQIGNLSRIITLYNGFMNIAPSSTSLANDYGNFNANFVNITFNPAVDNYIFVTGQLGFSGDTMYHVGTKITN